MHVHGHLMLADAEKPEHVTVTQGTIRIEDDRIAEVSLGDCPAHFDRGGTDCLILPGLVDTHVHLPQFDIIGAHGLPLLQWLEEYTFPAELRWRDGAFAEGMMQRVVDQCFAHGTTTVAAYATSHTEATRQAISVARQRGLAGLIGQVWMDRSGPSELLGSCEEFIDSTTELLNQSDERVGTAITPRFAVSCSAELLQAAGRLAKETGAMVQTHLAETRAECDLVIQTFDQPDYTSVYKAAGLVTPQSLFGHGIHLSPSERQQLAVAGAGVAHCPTANSFLRSGVMSRQNLRSDQVTIALGSDVGAGYERSMVRVGRAMIEAAAIAGGELPSPTHAWWQITYGNHAVLRPRQACGFTAEAFADLVIVRPDIPWSAEFSTETLSRLMFAWDDRWIENTIAGGRVVYPF